MIRFQRLTIAKLNDWLVERNTSSNHATYRLMLRQEEKDAFDPIFEDVRSYIQECFEDARRKLRKGFTDTLSPFNSDHPDPAANYPKMLHMRTLQGYLGEILAVLAVEHWGAFRSSQWQVPALLFRLHHQEFQHLDVINERLQNGGGHEPDKASEIRPGRTGDDAVAFRRDGDGAITHLLAIEAKCLNKHDSNTVREAHEKLGAESRRPPSIRELIELLSDYNTSEAEEWRRALLEFWSSGYKSAKRYDLLSYACGNQPKERDSWLPSDSPHASYANTWPLQAVELQLSDVRELVTSLLRDSDD